MVVGPLSHPLIGSAGGRLLKGPVRRRPTRARANRAIGLNASQMITETLCKTVNERPLKLKLMLVLGRPLGTAHANQSGEMGPR